MAVEPIVCAGHEIDPLEVERRLIEHPAVLEAVVVAKQDALRGQSVKAFVALRPGFAAGEAMEDALANYVESRLSVYAAPREFEFVDALPRTASGDIDRAKLAGVPKGVL